MEHQQPAAQSHHQAHLVFNQEHREFELMANAFHQIAEFDPLDVVQARGRLVEQQQARLGASARAISTRLSVP